MARGLKGIKKPHPLGSVPTRSGVSQLSVVPAASSATASGHGVKISELPAADAANSNDQLEINQNGVSRRVTVAQLASGVVGVNSIFNYGVQGDGSDETTTIQAAIDASAGNTLYFPPGTYVASSLTLPASIRLIGSGDASVIRQMAGTGSTTQLFVATATGIAIEFSNLTLDGNWQNQTNPDGTNASSIRFTSNGTASNPARLTVSDVTFRNGRGNDLWISPTGGDAAAALIDISHCRFLGGLNGTTTLGTGTALLNGLSIADFSHNYIDLLQTPTGSGRSGLVIQSEPLTATGPNRFTVIGNHFRNIGRDHADAIGVIDVYSNGADIVVQGNRLEQSYGRGITIKGDTTNAVVSGNIVNGLTSVVYPDGAQIYLAPSVNDTFNTKGKNVVVTGNTLSDSGKIAISLSYDETAPLGPAKGVVISNNAISNPLLYGVLVRLAYDIDIVGNTIKGSQIGILLDTVFNGTANISNNHIADTVIPGVSPIFRAGTAIYDNNQDVGTTARTTIQGNMIVNCPHRGIQKVSQGGGVIRGNTIINPGGIAMQLQSAAPTLVENNVMESPTNGFQVPIVSAGAVFCRDNVSSLGVRVLDNTVTNTANAITAPYDVVYVDTSTANQVVRTVSGVPDGCEVMVRMSSAAKLLALSETGGSTNLSIGSDIVLTSLDDNVVLRSSKQVDKMILVSSFLRPFTADTDAQSWATQVVTNGGTVSAGRLAVVSQFITAEKANGSWTLTDDYWLLAAENAVQSLTSLKRRTLATAVNAPTFVANLGYTSNGTTSYINPGFTPSTHAVQMTGINMRLGLYIRTNVASNTLAPAGVVISSTSNILVLPRRADNIMSVQLNNQAVGAGGDTTITDARGYSVGNRTNGSTAANVTAYKNGVAVVPFTPGTLSTTLPAQPVFICARSDGTGVPVSFYTGQVSFATVGGTVSAAQELQQYNNVQAWATSIGANV